MTEDSLDRQPMAVLWDLDGVIVDTGEFHYRAWEQTLPAYGIAISRELFRDNFGMNNAAALEHLAGTALQPDVVAEISRQKEETFRAAIHGQVQMLPGVRELLRGFRAGGVRQAVASSAPLANIDVLVDELNIRTCYDAIVSGAGHPSKPDPWVFRQAALVLQVEPRRCLVIEDAVTGVQGAQRAGMKCVAVTTTNPAEALQAAERVVDRLDQLPLEAYLRLIQDA